MDNIVIIASVIVIASGMVGYFIGYRQGSESMDKIYKDVYNIKEW
jgi:mannose/fructose/N-acetylgalactosamine-specific phosphotransferase system component IID